LRNDLKRVVNKKVCSKRHLARIAGRCVSTAKAVLPAKLLLRNTYRLLSKHSSWDATVIIDIPTLQDMRWWIISALESWNGYILKPRTDLIQMETDASATGWGSCIGTQETFGLWGQVYGNNAIELSRTGAVYLGLKSFSAVLQGKARTVLTGNITTCAYLNHLGGLVQTLTKLAQAVWALVFKLDISLRAHYLPGIDNVQADNLSRQKTVYEWMLNPGLFHHID
jgi:hypothetical protein